MRCTTTAGEECRPAEDLLRYFANRDSNVLLSTFLACTDTVRLQSLFVSRLLQSMSAALRSVRSFVQQEIAPSKRDRSPLKLSRDEFLPSQPSSSATSLDILLRDVEHPHPFLRDIGPPILCSMQARRQCVNASPLVAMPFGVRAASVRAGLPMRLH